MAWVYILRCADNSYYIGLSRECEIDTRLSEHELALFAGVHTATRRPIMLVYAEHFDRVTNAIEMERRIKGWSRAKKEALMRSDWHALIQLSKRHFGKPKA